ncbi:hypothetical protein DBR06_SOUSAS3210040, partial [Sousa chinensis]
VGEQNYGNRDQPLRQHVYRFRTDIDGDAALTPTPPSSTVERASRTLNPQPHAPLGGVYTSLCSP